MTYIFFGAFYFLLALVAAKLVVEIFTSDRPSTNEGRTMHCQSTTKDQ
jgi:hypothetical protein